MTFSELLDDIDFWVHTNETSFPKEDKTRSINEWLRTVNSTIWRVTNQWDFVDSNYDKLPIATGDLVATQADYSLPTTIQELLGVSVMDDGGNWHKLTPIDQMDVSIDMEEFNKTDGLPAYYDLVGQSIILYPAPAAASVTETGGLKLRLSRTIETFETTDTTKKPGFDEDYHRILSVGTSYDYAIANNMSERINDLRERLKNLLDGLRDFYGQRQRGRTARIKVAPISTI